MKFLFYLIISLFIVSCRPVPEESNVKERVYPYKALDFDIPRENSSYFICIELKHENENNIVLDVVQPLLSSYKERKLNARSNMVFNEAVKNPSVITKRHVVTIRPFNNQESASRFLESINSEIDEYVLNSYTIHKL